MKLKSPLANMNKWGFLRHRSRNVFENQCSFWTKCKDRHSKRRALQVLFTHLRLLFSDFALCSEVQSGAALKTAREANDKLADAIAAFGADKRGRVLGEKSITIANFRTRQTALNRTHSE